MNLPRKRYDLPKPYISAVSKKVIPAAVLAS
jgi:hypothetical protein